MKYTQLRHFTIGGESVGRCLRQSLPLLLVAVLMSLGTNSVRADMLEVRVADGNDDSEENPSGGIDLGSSDLELGAEGGGGSAQWIGLRFQNIEIPRAATINSASIQFTVDESDDEVQTMPIQIFGEVGDALAFSNSPGDITSRARTGVSVDWEGIPAWSTEGEAGPDQLTPDISPVVQAIVSQPGWMSGNAMVLLLSPHPNFERTAESFNGSPAGAALLTIDFDPTNLFLVGDFNSDGSIDSADYQVLADNFHTGTTFAEGDFNFDGRVDLFDFAGFRQALEATSTAGVAAVPEPCGAMLALVAFAVLGRGARKRR